MKARKANPMLDSILIPALEKIGDKQAVQSLISLIEKQDSSSSRYELVRPALVRLEKQSDEWCPNFNSADLGVALRLGGKYGLRRYNRRAAEERRDPQSRFQK